LILWLAACAENVPEGPPCEAGAAPAPVGLATAIVANGVRLDKEPYTDPQEMAFPPGDDSYWYVALHAGRVVRFRNDEANTAFEEVLDISDRVWSDHKQLGMMALTFHPDFANNGQMFVYYNRAPDLEPDGLDSVVSRFTSTDGGQTFDPTSEQILFDLWRPGALHDGGHLEFGTDGFLYVAMGDGGPSPESGNEGQDPYSPWAKLLRLDVDSGSPYAIPPDNPFADGILGAPEVFALGFRNPWQWTMDPLTGEIWVGDVGSSKWEEIDYVVAAGNYGWSVAEGDACLEDPCDLEGLVPPAYKFANVGATAVIGGRVYRGSLLPLLDGYFLFAEHFGQWLKGIRVDPSTGGFEILDVSDDLRFRPASFAIDTHGEVWVVNREDGAFYRLAPIPEDGPDVTLPTPTLSETGCTDVAVAPAAPSAVMRPYDVNVALWSDGATKDRFLRLPEGTTIDIDPESGDFDFPKGTVFMKHFSIGDELVETRLLVRHTDGSWGGYSYAWNDDQTEAFLLAESVTEQAGDIAWTFPGRTDCMKCHTVGAGLALGPEVLQLAPDQLAAWEGDGLFSAPVPEVFDGEEWALPDVADPSIPAATRARAYLHANCAGCHRAGGEHPDLTFHVDDAVYCNAATEAVAFDTTVLLAPGDPAASAIYARMSTVDPEFRMPPLATRVADPLGTSVVAEWIESVKTCPGPHGIAP